MDGPLQLQGRTTRAHVQTLVCSWPWLGAVVREAAPDAAFIVDSMSAFGAYDVDMRAANIHYLVSSANKAIEGVVRATADPPPHLRVRRCPPPVGTLSCGACWLHSRALPSAYASASGYSVKAARRAPLWCASRGSG